MAEPEAADGPPGGRWPAMSERERVMQFYQTSDAYAEMLDCPPSMSALEREAYFQSYVVLVASAATSPSARILDLGCGAGRTSALLAERGFSVVGADWSKRLVEQGPRRNPGTRAQYMVADAEQLPFASGSFDVVASLDLMEHTLRPQTSLAEMCRVLAPHGAIVVKCPNLLSPLRPAWYLAEVLLQRRPTPVWADNAAVALRGLAFNSGVTLAKLILRRPGFLRRAPALEEGTVAPDADATYFACAVDLRRWFSARAFRVATRVEIANDNAAQRFIRRVFPDLASPVALIARRGTR